MPPTTPLFTRCLVAENDLQRQKSRNWCWLAVAEAISRKYDPHSRWTQERIFLEVARSTLNLHKYPAARTIEDQLLDGGGDLKGEWSYQKLSSSEFDRRGSIEAALTVTDNLGLTRGVPDRFPDPDRDVFGHVASEIKNGRVGLTDTRPSLKTSPPPIASVSMAGP